MNILRITIVAVAVMVVAGGISARAVVTPEKPAAHLDLDKGKDKNADKGKVLHGTFVIMGFRDRPEADLLRRAYHILATGDHDYNGHRARAMEAVKAAGHFLGMDLAGDDHDHEKQVLSDDRLREARGDLQRVLGAAEVKDQKKIARHIHAAINDIDVALRIK